MVSLKFGYVTDWTVARGEGERRRGGSNRSNGNSEHGTLESGKPFNPQFLTRCFNGKQDSVPRKTTPSLAVPQQVNVHASLPLYDGTAEMPGAEANQVDSDPGRGECSKQGHTQKDRRWDKKRRVMPSPAVLREFFRRIQEEERSMIYKYQMGNENALLFD